MTKEGISLREKMEIIDVSRCTGCSLCAFVCPVKAIDMDADVDNPFLRPSINLNKCIDCGLCQRMCPETSELLLNSQKQHFVAQNRDVIELSTSTSGAVADALAKAFVSAGGVVYGAAFNSNMELLHIRCDNLSNCNEIKGSKYVQSNVLNAYFAIKNDIELGRRVLFVGTPCQCAAVKKGFQDNENLYCCDFVCNGVGSPIVFKKHIEYLEKKYKCQIVKYIFRPKTEKYLEPYEEFVDRASKKYRIKSPWKKWGSIYYAGLAMREACFCCHYSQAARPSSITLSDIPLDLLRNDNMQLIHSVNRYGASLVSINDNKGCELLNSIRDFLSLEEVDLMINDYNKHLTHSVQVRDDFCNRAKISLEDAKISHLGWKIKIKSMLIDAIEHAKERRR